MRSIIMARVSTETFGAIPMKSPTTNTGGRLLRQFHPRERVRAGRAHDEAVRAELYQRG
jgi:hypothetical protein